MGGRKKEYLPLEDGLSVLGSAVSAFASCQRIGPIVILLPSIQKKEDRPILSKVSEELRQIYPYTRDQYESNRRCLLFVTGGQTRRASVYNALMQLDELHPSYVLIHDGARPWIKKPLIENIIDAVVKYDAVIPALEMTETPKELYWQLQPKDAGDNFIKTHLKRMTHCLAQTPQAFKFPEILISHNKAAVMEKRNAVEYTDDAEIWAEFMGKVAVISGDPDNRKITYPEDIRN